MLCAASADCWPSPIAAALCVVYALVSWALQLARLRRARRRAAGHRRRVNLAIIVLAGARCSSSTLEARLNARRALTALHEFRSIAHVIDMHQLTKDPSALGGPRTSSSPERA